VLAHRQARRRDPEIDQVRPDRGGSCAGTHGRPLRRDVDPEQLPPPVRGHEGQEAARALLRARRLDHRRGGGPCRGRGRDHQRAARPGAGRQGPQRRALRGQGHPAPQPAFHPGRPRPHRGEFGRPALVGRLRVQLRQPGDGPAAQLLSRDRGALAQGAGLRDDHERDRPHHDRLSSGARRRAPGRLRTGAGKAHRGQHDQDAARAEHRQQEVQAHPGLGSEGRAHQALHLQHVRLHESRRDLERHRALVGRGAPRGRRRTPGGPRAAPGHAESGRLLARPRPRRNLRDRQAADEEHV
ncbi:MAG: Manganese catalase, partial [uncultured Microvirga sp.]